MIVPPRAADTGPAWLNRLNIRRSLVLARYSVRPLTPERIPEAFPTVAFLDDEVTAERWSDYANAIVGPNGQDDGHGIMTLQDPQNRIVGLSAYTIRADLQRGRVLVVENFAVAALIGARQAAATLLAAMEQLARDRDCRCLAVSLVDRKVRRSPDRHRSQTRQFFRGAGFRLDLARLYKYLGPTTAGQPGTDGGDARPERAQFARRPR
ncbi:MAG TPA: hypothetical protein VGA50_19955 [Kiloniellales bacterium]